MDELRDDEEITLKFETQVHIAEWTLLGKDIDTTIC